MKVLIACEFSGIVREAFRKMGHDAWSCDLLPTEIPGQHIQGDVIDSLIEGPRGGKWDLVIAHPPCTYLSNSGVRWLYKSNGDRNHERWEKLISATRFFRRIQATYNSGFTERLCIENPIPHKYARNGFTFGKFNALYNGIGEYSQIIQPYQFGHTTSKATCLWLYGLSELAPTNIIPKDKRTFDIHRMAPSTNRQKERSRTFQGIADAMAEQWG